MHVTTANLLVQKRPTFAHNYRKRDQLLHTTTAKETKFCTQLLQKTPTFAHNYRKRDKFCTLLLQRDKFLTLLCKRDKLLHLLCKRQTFAPYFAKETNFCMLSKRQTFMHCFCKREHTFPHNLCKSCSYFVRYYQIELFSHYFYKKGAKIFADYGKYLKF